MFIEIALALLALLLTIFHITGQYNEKYWTKRGVKFYSRNKFFGPFWDYIMGPRALFEIFGDIYKEYENEAAVGVGSMFTPALYIRDATNLAHILQLDFNSFNHRGIENFEGDQLSENILFLNGPKWKLMRQSMTPLFTATKLKNMYCIMDKGAQDLVEYIKDNPERQKGDAYVTMTNYCSAAITASVFGIGTESIFDSPFVEVARASTAPSFALNIKFSIANLSRSMTRLLGITLFTKHEKFFISAMKRVLEKRETENIKRHDFADIALSLQKNGILRDESTGCEMKPTVGLLSAQAFFFFIAGVEPSATVLFCALVELGRNRDILKKLQEEIDDVFENSKYIDYDVISTMHFLDKVLNETLRIYPPIGFLTRECVKDTVLPVGSIKIDKGTKVYAPIYHIHHDPKYYSVPEKFDPERFSKNDAQDPNDSPYMPFGKGSRACIGARYARLEVKAGLVHLLRHFCVNTLNYDLIKFKKELMSVRPTNVDVEFIPRTINAK